MLSLAISLFVLLIETVGYSAIALSVRLVGGQNDGEGRVEVNQNGVWGTVCDDEWTLADAKVVCRQLGFSYARSYVRYAEEFGRGSGTIWMDDVRCSGDETDLSECIFSGWNNSNCNHAEDAGVVCAPHVAADEEYKCNCSNATSSVLSSQVENATVVSRSFATSSSVVTPSRRRSVSSSTSMEPSFCSSVNPLESWHIIVTVLGGFFAGVVLTVVAIIIRDSCCLSDDAEKDEVGSKRKRRSFVFSFRRSRSSMKSNPLYGGNQKYSGKGTLGDSGSYSYAYDHVGPKSPVVPEQREYDSLQRNNPRETLSSATDSQYNKLFGNNVTMKRSESQEAYCTLARCK